MVYDRALTRELLDVGLRVATSSGDRKDARRLLTVALRDYVSGPESEGKTKKCVSRVWVAPPEPARDMIRWAIEHQAVDIEHTILHLGALLASFPFFGAVASIVGRQLHLDGHVDPRRVRAEACQRIGDRSTIDVGARKVLTTFRYLNLLDGPPTGPLHGTTFPAVPTELSGWIAHSILLTRQVQSAGLDDIERAFELATVKFAGVDRHGYPLLTRHAESGRIVISV
jgi:hypothetical protein